ncbi:MAG: 16S rRNA (uracil(1498)-N(3))-methyltransferase [Spirochaetes bacterium]|nr:16S rRNA (uracil(1498)-N(3))-methyltransferase [Spirochaetota bacterium]
MPQFFVTSSSISNGRCTIGGDDFHHLVGVRRVRTGDTIRLRDDKGASLSARIESITADRLTAVIISESDAPHSPVDITLCMCLLKGGNFDLAVEKAVEVGVSRIIAVASERTVPRPSDIDSKLRRWNRKAEEAAKQSLRERVPPVEGIRTFDEVLAGDRDRARIIAHPGSPLTLKEFLRSTEPGAVTLLVGPEGGFSPAELDAAAAAGWVAAGFGFSQLRAETAAPVLCGIIMYEWGD